MLVLTLLVASVILFPFVKGAPTKWNCILKDVCNWEKVTTGENTTYRSSQDSCVRRGNFTITTVCRDPPCSCKKMLSFRSESGFWSLGDHLSIIVKKKIRMKPYSRIQVSANGPQTLIFYDVKMGEYSNLLLSDTSKTVAVESQIILGYLSKLELRGRVLSGGKVHIGDDSKLRLHMPGGIQVVNISLSLSGYLDVTGNGVEKPTIFDIPIFVGAYTSCRLYTEHWIGERRLLSEQSLLRQTTIFTGNISKCPVLICIPTIRGTFLKHCSTLTKAINSSSTTQVLHVSHEFNGVSKKQLPASPVELVIQTSNLLTKTGAKTNTAFQHRLTTQKSPVKTKSTSSAITTKASTVHPVKLDTQLKTSRFSTKSEIKDITSRQTATVLNTQIQAKTTSLSRGTSNNRPTRRTSMKFDERTPSTATEINSVKSLHTHILIGIGSFLVLLILAIALVLIAIRRKRQSAKAKVATKFGAGMPDAEKNVGVNKNARQKIQKVVSSGPELVE